MNGVMEGKRGGGGDMEERRGVYANGRLGRGEMKRKIVLC